VTDFGAIFKNGLYRFMLGGPYEDYVQRSATKIIERAPSNARSVLSVGCGNGDVEAFLADRFDITLHDVHDAARIAHPELHWVSSLPNNQFDYVYAHGAVFACVPHEQKQQFVDDLAARVVDGGTLYLCMGYAKQCRICRGKVYSIDGHTVTEYVASRGDGWQEIVTHIWGLQKISSVYYTADIGPLWQKHSARITTIT
jgi:hypothetical protein